MNFKNHFELYKALIEGKTIIYNNGAMVKVSSDSVLVSYDNGGSWGSSCWSFDNPEQWKIYDKPEAWYRVTSFRKVSDRPYLHNGLYSSKDDFLKDVQGKEEDYRWIHLEEFYRRIK